MSLYLHGALYLEDEDGVGGGEAQEEQGAVVAQRPQVAPTRVALQGPDTLYRAGREGKGVRDTRVGPDVLNGRVMAGRVCGH